MDEDGIRALIFEEDGIFVAQCLEFDLSAQGDTLQQAGDRLVATVEIALQDRDLDTAPIAAAPRDFERLWDEGDHDALPSQQVDGHSVSFTAA